MKRALVKKLVSALDRTPVRGRFSNEADFEHRFVEKVCKRVAGQSIKLYVHPWGDKVLAPDWRASKEWGAVHCWGTVQAFDVLARDETSAKTLKNTLAVEVKLSKSEKVGLPTGDFQKMLGQCLLARLVHTAVIGVFGHVGELRTRDRDEGKKYLRKLATEYNIWVVLKKIG